MTACRALMARMPSFAQARWRSTSCTLSGAGSFEDAVRCAADALGLAGDANQPLGLVVGRAMYVAAADRRTPDHPQPSNERGLKS